MGQANTKAKKIAVDAACVVAIGGSLLLIPGAAPLAVGCKIGCFAGTVGFRAACHEGGFTIKSLVESAIFCAVTASIILFTPKMISAITDAVSAVVSGCKTDTDGTCSDSCGAHSAPCDNAAFNDMFSGLSGEQNEGISEALAAAGQYLSAAWQKLSLPSTKDIVDAVKGHLPTINSLLFAIKLQNLSPMKRMFATIIISWLLSTAVHKLSKSEWMRSRSHLEHVILAHVERCLDGESLSSVVPSFVEELMALWAKYKAKRDRENLPRTDLTRTALVRYTPNDGIYKVVPEALNFVKDTIGTAPFKIVALMGPNADRSHRLKEFLESKGYAIDLPSPTSRRQTTGKPDIGVWAYALQRERLLILDSTENLGGFCLAVASHAVYSICETTGLIADADLDHLTKNFSTAYAVQNGWYTRAVVDREKPRQSLHLVSSKDIPPNPIVISDSRRQEWQGTMQDFNVPTDELPMFRWSDFDLSDVPIHHQCYRGNDDYWDFFNETFTSVGVSS